MNRQENAFVYCLAFSFFMPQMKIQAVTGITVECIGKPAPYLFLYGLQMYGAKPDSCVMIGDNLETDILGGRRVGMKTVWIENKVQEVFSSQHYVSDYKVRSIFDLYEMVSMQRA